MKKLFIALCIMTYAVGFSQEWYTDFGAAKKAAAQTNKKILLVFSGPEWCANCARLDQILWNSPEFKAQAEKKWVLLRADFPQKKGIPEPFNVNDEKVILAEKYNRDGFFPFMVLLDKNGLKLDKQGYENLQTTGEYVAMLDKMGK